MTIQKYFPEGYRCAAVKNAPFAIHEIEKAISGGEILEARAVLCDSEQNLVVELGCMKGIIARDEVVYTRDEVKNIAVITRVGKTVCFKVTEIVKNAKGELTAILSRRAAQREAYENFVSQLIPGEVIPARVTHLEPFGAFVDVACGIVSLISVDNISVSRISHPSDRFSVGQEIFCVVKDVDDALMRISVSHKELLGTWEENAGEYMIGQTAAGIVRSVENYGIFVELTPNLAGLAEFKEGVAQGQSACVYIKNIIPEKMKVKLVIIDSFDEILTPAPQPYRITDGKIDVWRYSPDASEKVIETVF